MRSATWPESRAAVSCPTIRGDTEALPRGGSVLPVASEQLAFFFLIAMGLSLLVLLGQQKSP